MSILLILALFFKSKMQEAPMTNELLFWDKVLSGTVKRYLEHPMGELASKTHLEFFVFKLLCKSKVQNPKGFSIGFQQP